VDEYKRIWAEGGDSISQIYANSDALTSKVVMKGYRNLFDTITEKLSSAKRFISATFSDAEKHSTIEVLLGTH
jgi:hypothetical protein